MAANDPRSAQLNQAFRDVKTMVNKVLGQSGPVSDAMFRQYFDPSMRNVVDNVLTTLVRPAYIDPASGADGIASIGIDMFDYDPTMAIPYVLAYTTNEPVGALMHFKQNNHIDIFSLAQLTGIRCSNLDPFVSWKMVPLVFIVLHELT